VGPLWRFTETEKNVKSGRKLAKKVPGTTQRAALKKVPGTFLGGFAAWCEKKGRKFPWN